MIGICCEAGEREAAREFFELFKTPWEFCAPGRHYHVVISTLYEIPATEAGLLIVFRSAPAELDDLKGISAESAPSGYVAGCDGTRLPIYGGLARLRGQGRPVVHGRAQCDVFALAQSDGRKTIVRAGYDLLREVAFLLAEGQPTENALIPALEMHIALVRQWIIDARVPFVEIPPVPWGHEFIACLTHDVDFVSIRQHRLDSTFWGFVYRALIGSGLAYVKGDGSLGRLAKNWKAVLSLPFVYLGVARDFWGGFEAYVALERGLSSTFFLIPYKRRPGENVQGRHPARRATHYDIDDVRTQVGHLISQGFEVALHGIDAWHSAQAGRQERARIADATCQDVAGVRMHWLCFGSGSPTVLEEAGFGYDSTFGYNRAVGYRGGTTQVFRPAGTTHLLELPLHVQDTALFYALAKTNGQAWDLCSTMMDGASRHGGVVTFLWHMRSLAPERLWGDFYKRLLQELLARGAWCGSAGQVVRWFRQRRSVTFEDCSVVSNTMRLRLSHDGLDSGPAMILRVYRPPCTGAGQPDAGRCFTDLQYTGESVVEIPLG